MLLVSLVVSLVGCASPNSCKEYVDAAATCTDGAGADASAYDADTICGNWTEADEATYGTWYQCRATAFDDADCTTQEGLDAASVAAESCQQ